MMTSVWQHSSIQKTNLYMLDNQLLCDITFLVGDDKMAMKCHKYMLVSRSPVFYTMFCGSIAETSDTISLPDVEPDIWSMFIRVLYGGQCDLDGHNVLHLLYMAKKYDLPDLLATCKTFLEDNITIENVCTLLDQSILFDVQDLTERCLTIISSHTMAVFKSAGFTELSLDGLKHVVGLEKMTIPGEEEVYRACKNWAVDNCKKQGIDSTQDTKLREALGNVLPLIRFPSMAINVFTKLVAPEQLLTDKEKVLIIRDIVNNECVSKFNRDCRVGSMLKTIEITRLGINNRSYFNIWKHTGKLDGISFEVSKEAELDQVSLFLPKTEGILKGDLEILENEHIVISQTVELHYKIGLTSEYISLQQPVIILPKNTYSIRQRLRGVNSYRGEGRLDKDPSIGINVNFFALKYGTSDNGTDVNTGMIRGLKLKIRK